MGSDPWKCAARDEPVLKTLEQFHGDWPEKINRLQVQNLFRLECLVQKANVVLLGNVGLGKTPLAIASGYAACQEDYSVLFAEKGSKLLTHAEPPRPLPAVSVNFLDERAPWLKQPSCVTLPRDSSG